MKQTCLVFSFFFVLFLVPGVEAQQLGVSQTQVDAIKNALQRIAISNNAVENAIYDG